MRLDVPITPELTEELYDFWGEIFGPPPHELPPRVLLGHEQEHNRNILYLTRRGGSLAGTCLTTIPKGVPRLETNSGSRWPQVISMAISMAMASTTWPAACPVKTSGVLSMPAR